jgi:hypothetical protein
MPFFYAYKERFMSKTIAIQLEVVTRSTVTVLVDIPAEVGPNRYGYLGKALFDAIPEAVYTKSDRSFERLSYDKSSGTAQLVVRLDGEGKIELVKKDDLVELSLVDSGSMDSDRVVALVSGMDDQGREIVTSPAKAGEVMSLLIKYNPYTDDPLDNARALNIVERSFGSEVLAGTTTVRFESFTDEELNWIDGVPYLEVVAKIRRPRHAFALSSYDEFSRFLFGMYGEDDTDLGIADFELGALRYLENRTAQLVK